MVYLKDKSASVFVIVLLSLEGFYSTPKRKKYSASTSTAPFSENPAVNNALQEYVTMYHKTLSKYVIPGELKTIEQFCENEVDEKKDICEGLIFQFFVAKDPKDILQVALYSYNRYNADKKDIYAKNYFHSVVENCRFKDIEDDRFQTPVQFCEKKIEMPPGFETHNLDLSLHL